MSGMDPNEGKARLDGTLPASMWLIDALPFCSGLLFWGPAAKARQWDVGTVCSPPTRVTQCLPSLSLSPLIPLFITPNPSPFHPIPLPFTPYPSSYQPPSLPLSPPIPLLIAPHPSPYHPPSSPYHPTSLFYHFPPHLFSIPCRAMRQSQPCSRAPITARPKGDQCN